MKRRASIDYEREIPLMDCIMVEQDTSGVYTGFSIRPEMAKVIMWRESGDLTMLHRVIKTVNYMNRLIFDPQDYLLGSKKKPENKFYEEKHV
jgi:hypothetical protein